jgi:hypothetical protein
MHLDARGNTMTCHQQDGVEPMKTLKLTTLALLASIAATAVVAADDKAPMPQTRGMQGMDPRDHDKPAKDAYADCTPNAEKVANQAQHPMPDTKGMHGMDPKAHTVDCPPAATDAKKDEAKHVHKAPGN